MRLREKNSEKIFMTEKVYHIYAKDRCIYHSLKKEEFEIVWESLNNLVEIYTEVGRSDLQYEVVTKNLHMIHEGSY
jgi:hypothetical protein